MRQTLVFSGVAFGLVVLVVLAAWPFLERSSWTWLVVAGAGAFAAQLLLHVVLSKWRTDPKRFVAGILLGAAARLAIVVTALVWVALRGHPHPVALLLGLAGFLCGMLMIEASLENSNWYRHLSADGLAQASTGSAAQSRT